ncbi:MAG TPA: SDR family NAD(P)-dependent oxidoreductase [Caldilineae bacterium]|nr:SDR family NAD(P)-dependent oxidoreductase [Caldilineae bacterium]
MQPTIIITGASRGLGAATARQLAQLGANLVLNARSERLLTALAHEINEQGGQALAVAGDVSQPAVCDALVAAALETFGGVDTLINNAAVLEPIASIAETDVRAWRRHIDINLIGPYLLTRAALPSLRERHGRVINVSSGAAVSVLAGWSAYCASKAALNQLSASVALEEPDVTSLAVRPGKVDTDMQAVLRQAGATGMASADHRRFVQHFEKGELLPPERPAAALAALALAAPHDWSGQFISWNDPQVQMLVQSRIKD